MRQGPCVRVSACADSARLFALIEGAATEGARRPRVQRRVGTRRAITRVCDVRSQTKRIRKEFLSS